MKSLKNKLFVILSICLSVLLGTFAGFLVKNNQHIYADDLPYKLVVAKYRLLSTTTVDDYVIANGQLHYYANKTTGDVIGASSTGDSLIQTVDNDDAVMLCNANLESFDDPSKYYKEYLVVSFAPVSNSSFTLGTNIDVTATLNGKAIYTKRDISEIQEAPQSYYQFFDLTDIQYTNNAQTSSEYTDVEEYSAQGYYNFTFKYNTPEGNGRLTASINFYLLDENYYINATTTSNAINQRDNINTASGSASVVKPYDTITTTVEKYKAITFNKTYNFCNNTNGNQTEPRLVNTERLDRQLDSENGSSPVEYNYFNYTNLGTADYDGNTESVDNTLIKYPTVVYDPSKYNVSFIKSIYGVTTSVTSVFDKNTNIVTFTYNTNGTKTIKTIKATPTMPKNYYYVQLENGKYYSVDALDKKPTSADITYYSNLNGDTTGESNYVKDKNGNFIELATILTKLTTLGKYYIKTNVSDTDVYTLVTSPVLNYTANLVLDELGVYQIDYNYCLFVSGNTPTTLAGLSVSETETRSQLKVENWNIVGTTNLTIYGYQLQYSDYKNVSGAQNTELKNVEQNLYCDVSNANVNTEDKILIADVELNSNSKSDTISFANKLNTYSSVVSTNQAPLSFKYFASMIANGAATQSYYIRYDKKDGNRYNSNGTLLTDTTLTAEQIASTKISIASNARFTSNGYYEVYVAYTYPDYKNITNILTNSGISASAMTKVQVFAFVVANIEPEVNFNLMSNGTIGDAFDKNGYTNKDVYISWANAIASPFNVKPEVTVSIQGFEANAKSSLIDISSTSANGYYVATVQGLYVINVAYGPCIYNSATNKYVYSASVVYMFTIDKTSLEDFIFANYLTSDFYVSDSAKFNSISKNSFIITFGQVCTAESTFDGNDKVKDGLKPSGAQISMTYTFLPFSDSSSANKLVLFTEEDNQTLKSLITNGKQVNSKNEGIVYNQVEYSKTSSNNDITNTYEVSNVGKRLVSDGIYILQFKDSAGNDSTKYIIKDTSSPIGLQSFDTTATDTDKTWQELPSQNNIINKDVVLAWGNYKAITISNDYTSLFNSVDTFIDSATDAEIAKIGTLGTTTYLIVGINTMTNTNLLDTYKANDGAVEQPTQITNNELKGYSYKLTACNTTGANYNDGHIYTIQISDACGNSSIVNSIEVSFDKSQFQAYISGAASNNIQTISKTSSFESSTNTEKTRFYSNRISNKQTLYVNWVNNAGSNDTTYEISSVTYSFFPLNYDTSSANYPYSNVATLQNINLMDKTTITTVNSSLNGNAGSVSKTESYGINLSQDSRFSTTSTMAGMYVITRKYVNSDNANNDLKDMSIILYIDRNNLISNDSAKSDGIIGNQIQITMGTTDTTTFIGSNFLQEFANTYIFETNKLPVKISIPLYKYATSLSNSSSLQLNKLQLNVMQIQPSNTVATSISDDGTMLYAEFPTTTSSATYSVTISDSANGNASGNQSVIDKTTTNVTFTLVINPSRPTADFVNSSNVTLGENPSVNNQNVNLVWYDDATGFKAKIDTSSIAISTRTENSANIHTVENTTIQNALTANGASHTLNLSKVLLGDNLLNGYISSATKTNFYCDITLQYTGSSSDYGDFYSTTKRIYFDFSMPSFNYNSLVNNDNLLSGLIGDEEFYDYNSAINFENYAFIVNNDWTLTQCTSTPKTESTYFWQSERPNGNANNYNDAKTYYWRQYNKYTDDSAECSQSIVPTDARYSDYSVAPQRYRFSPNLTDKSGNLIYHLIEGAANSQNYIAGNYYEIIECDCANNYRIYTIYVTDGTTKITYDYNVDFSNKSQTNPTNMITFDTTNLVKQIYNKSIAFSDFTYLGEWFKVSVTNAATKETTDLKCAPKSVTLDGYLSPTDLLETLNSKIIPTNSATGDFFTITFTSSYLGAFTIEYRTQGGTAYKLTYSTNETAKTFTVTIDNTQLIGNFLVTFRTYRVIDGQVVKDGTINQYSLLNTSEVKYNYDNLGADAKISITFNSNAGYNLYFVYTDYYGNTREDNQILGIAQTYFDNVNTTNAMLNFNSTGSYKLANSNVTDTSTGIKKTAEYYTNKQVTFQFQSQIYTLTSAKSYNITDIKGAENDITSSTLDRLATNGTTGVKYINNLFSVYDESACDLVYIISLADTSGNTYEYTLHYFTKLADVKFMDSTDSQHFESETETLISTKVFVSFDKDQYPEIATSVSVSRKYTDATGSSMTQNYGVVNTNYIFNDYGVYTVVATNILGTKKTWTFEYKQSTATYYSVTVTPENGSTIELSPCEVKYQYGNEEIDQYISIYAATVNINGTKNLMLTDNGSSDDGMTKIWTISTNPNSPTSIDYQKTIAVTKIDSTTNLLEDMFKINGTDYLTTTKTYTSKTDVTITIPSFYEYKNNRVKVSCTFDGKDVGKIALDYTNDTTSFTLSNAGVYDLYITDLAGNTHIFGSTTKYITIYLLNNVLYNLNGERGIYNSIYNSSVTLTFDQIEKFTRLPSAPYYIAVSATLNGEDYTPTATGGIYTFASYGTYYVTMSAFVGDYKDDTNKVTTTAKFSIVNQNEARLIHEYIGLNGYQITSIIKDGNDITDSIRAKLNMSTINQVALTGGIVSDEESIGGNGHYTITVQANYDKIIGSRTFSYNIWLNSDSEALILCSLNEGDKTTQTIYIKLNLNQIYSKIGECKVKLNGVDFITINASTAGTNQISTYELTANQRYNVTLETSSGNTALSFVVTKVEPLNTVAIIVIVVVSVVAAALATTFIILRKRMRVK